MNRQLNALETRVIGVLIEKEITTPDQYPLSLNALTAGCNQKSNRDPVLDLSEAQIQQTVDGLIKKYLVSRASGFGNRVTKYQHRFCNTEFGDLKLSPQELGIVCELLLRGPQTPGELRMRTERLCRFDDVQQVEASLQRLMERDEPLVARLPREPGKRESRYAHRFGDDTVESAAAEDGSTAADDRLSALEQTVLELREEIDRLKTRIDDITGNITAT